MSIKSFAASITELEPLKTLLWSIVVGIAIASTAWANVNNRITANAVEIVQVRQELKEEIADRKSTLGEWRTWRESTAKQLSRIEATNEAILRELKR